MRTDRASVRARPSVSPPSTAPCAKLLSTIEARAAYTQKSRALKWLVAREKRNASRSFCDELLNTQLAQFQAIIKPIAKAKKEIRDRPPVTRQDPELTRINTFVERR